MSALCMGEEPSLQPTRRYSINEVCDILGMHRNTLRKKTADGSIKCSYRKEGSRMYPFYLGKDIMKFWRAVI